MSSGFEFLSGSYKQYLIGIAYRLQFTEGASIAFLLFTVSTLDAQSHQGLDQTLSDNLWKERSLAS